ncbi:MAG: bifunctional adenosylcobinamide kinase/adenosylcobinamide-phosphate guanylyltransferase [Comamonadaceae bacterium]|nr:MAG: bifunctional adenosylcobinamide kinase/adenosylcobinamide-phosphate guanylyltransferase [Comamonadaceae bacterium]
MSALGIVSSELILGGQKSGKSRRAELLARDWLASGGQDAVLVATAQPWDDEMQERIVRHQHDRALRVPGLRTVEEPLDLAGAIVRHSASETLLVVDCLTLWLTNLLMPADALHAPRADEAMSRWGDPDDSRFVIEPPQRVHPADTAQIHISGLVAAIHAAPGPVVFVGNEIGLGVIPMGREVRAFVDALGLLNQQVAAACERVVLMAAGLPLVLKAGQS